MNWKLNILCYKEFKDAKKKKNKQIDKEFMSEKEQIEQWKASWFELIVVVAYALKVDCVYIIMMSWNPTISGLEISEI